MLLGAERFEIRSTYVVFTFSYYFSTSCYFLFLTISVSGRSRGQEMRVTPAWAILSQVNPPVSDAACRTSHCQKDSQQIHKG